MDIYLLIAIAFGVYLWFTNRTKPNTGQASNTASNPDVGTVVTDVSSNVGDISALVTHTGNTLAITTYNPADPGSESAANPGMRLLNARPMAVKARQARKIAPGSLVSFALAILTCMSLTGCMGLANTVAQLKDDPATVDLQVSTLYGTFTFHRSFPTNTIPVK